ncbi:pentapeptide repeat-containing protein [Actinoplanes sp. HUAS TT8]|uniref:pentapeptide repeat-containing protein n=1 Tax=Actinoplanes sp. HUAS TT8 TaxID=3447453 RepID=UPI003F527BA9
MSRLEADCTRCAALCCVAPAFAKSSDFAVNKPAGQPCRNLGDDFRCGIHEELPRRGFKGCVVFDCFGAGQRITQETFDGRDWRGTPGIAGSMFALLPVVRQLHELLWLLTEAMELDEAAGLRPRLRAAFEEIDAVAARPADELRGLDVDTYRKSVVPLLRRVSDQARAGAGGRRPDHSGAQLIGRRFRGADLRGASFRGAVLVGADLSGADLRRADFTGADLRGADLRGADLTGALFLTPSQLRAAVTDAAR